MEKIEGLSNAELLERLKEAAKRWEEAKQNVARIKRELAENEAKLQALLEQRRKVYLEMDNRLHAPKD